MGLVLGCLPPDVVVSIIRTSKSITGLCEDTKEKKNKYPDLSGALQERLQDELVGTDSNGSRPAQLF